MQEEKKDELSVNPSMITIFRGHIFVSNLQKLIDSKQALQNLKSLSQRTCQLDMNLISYRTLHHWDSVGLIECGRESSKSGWRKFNLVEALWLHVIIKFRDMGVSLEKIGEAKTIFFEKIGNLNLKFIDYYLVGVLYFKTPTFFVMPSDEVPAFLSYDEMTQAMEAGLLNNAILIHLNPLLNKIFKKIEVCSDFSSKRTLTKEQRKVCDFMDMEDFDSMKISKADGKISEVEFEKGFSRKESYRKVIESETDALITVRRSKGVVASIKRAKRAKLNED